MALNRIFVTFLLIFIPFLSCNLLAEEKSNVEFQVVILDDHHIILKAEIDDGFKLYASKKGSVGVPFEIQAARNSLTVESISWPDYHTDMMPHGEYYYYLDHIEIPIKLIYHKDNPALELTYSICKESCVLESQVIDINASVNKNIWWMLLIAVLGGFILNFMPCVLPVLSLKVINIANAKNLLATICGIISVFLILAIFTIILRHYGMEFGMGVQFQQPGFIIFLIIIMVFFVSNLLGRFEITLPNFITNSKIVSKENLSGFFEGALATILATPCSAPLVGSATAYALSHEPIVIIAIFLAMGVGMALPFMLLSIYPNLGRLLPKPGKWMLVLKKILAVSLILSIFWLVNILIFQIGFWPSIGFILLMILMKFVLESNFRFKIISIFFIILLAFTLPKIESKYFALHEKNINKIWHSFDENEIASATNNGKIVFIAISAKWCATCQINELLVLNRPGMLKFLGNDKFYLMHGDMTNKNSEISKFMAKYQRVGIPFYIIFKPGKDPIILPELLTESMLKNALNY